MKESEDLVIVGRVLREWGLRGEVIVLPLTFDPERFSKLDEVAIHVRDSIEYRKLRSVRPYRGNLLVGFSGCETPEDARRYRGALIKINRLESPRLPDGLYYHYQIIGLDVYALNGDHLGKIVSIFETGSNDVYVVRGEESEYLIPAIRDVVKEIDLEGQRVIVKPMEVEEE